MAHNCLPFVIGNIAGVGVGGLEGSQGYSEWHLHLGIIACWIFHTSTLCPINVARHCAPPPSPTLSEWAIRALRSWQFGSPNLLDATSTGMTTKTTTRKSSVALTIKHKIRVVVLRYHKVAPKTFQINICGSYKQMWLTHSDTMYTAYIIMVIYVAGGHINTKKGHTVPKQV